MRSTESLHWWARQNVLEDSHFLRICVLSNQLFRGTHLQRYKNPVKRGSQPDFFGWILITCSLYQSSFACTDIKGDLSAYPCLTYTHSVIDMKCSFAWTTDTECIVLDKDERFEGNGHSIDLTEFSDWEGLFQIADSTRESPSSLEDAPIIHDLHTIGGRTSQKGGFIIRAFQKHFIVEKCSSSGLMQGGTSPIVAGGGGICGHACSGDILITHCWSSGTIQGFITGGIAGTNFGFELDETNTATISHCYSTGDLLGDRSGGICGNAAGFRSKGMVTIESCYSLGKINGAHSGGITGTSTAADNGHVSITNCYSRGKITGRFHAGGICGRHTGGNVILTNVYASGQIVDPDAAGLIGDIEETAAEIIIISSVYNGDTDKMIGGIESAHIEEKNSGDLRNITGTVYCYKNGKQEECWDTKTIWQAVDDDFPILQGMPNATPHPTPSVTPLSTPTASVTPSRVVPVHACLHYDDGHSVFNMTCSFAWTDQFKSIVLRKHERFEGNGHSINLTGISNWEGLFQISDSFQEGPSSLDDAPIIHDVHMIGGETSVTGGFIIQAGQKHFVVDYCSSSGLIQGSNVPRNLGGGGGICGEGCSGDILITHCLSSGVIQGYSAGGIAGRRFGVDGGKANAVNISNCYSIGDIVGTQSGGICGNGAGHSSNGRVTIKQCYSSGGIQGRQSGGITGAVTAMANGRVSISNSYSRGNITGPQHAGGICGRYTGHEGGNVILANVYASGQTITPGAGSLIGTVDSNPGNTSIIMSVYNGDTGEMIGGIGDVTIEAKNSGDLRNITGTVYCYRKEKEEECWDTEKIWQEMDSDFPVLQDMPNVIPSRPPQPTSTMTASVTRSVTRTTSKTSSPTPTFTASVTQSGTASWTSSSTPSMAPSKTPSMTRTAYRTTTATASPSDISATNGSRVTISACGTLQEFDCATINYDATVRVVRNITDKPVLTKLRNTSTITAQAVDGIVPSLEFVCGIDVNGETVSPADCSDESSAGQNGIPFHAKYEMMSNRSCIARIRTNRCRLFVFVVNILVTGNVSNSKMRSLREEELLATYAMTTSLMSGEETLLSTRQPIQLLEQITESETAAIGISSHPSTYSNTIHRKHDTSKSHNITVQLAGRSDLRVSWILPPRLSLFMETPKTQSIASQLVLPRLEIREQILSIGTHLLPHGISVGAIRILFNLANELVATRILDVNITVLQGDVRLRQSSIEISRSSTEGPTSRSILLANEGDKEVLWTRQIFPVQVTGEKAGEIPWLAFPNQGSLPPNEERSFSLEVSPELVTGLGVFEAWIFIETDSWTGDSQTLEEEFGAVAVPRFDVMDVSFWIHVRFVVSSIFVCQQFAPLTTMGPNELHVLPLRVINTESAPITVILSNFSITTARNVSVAVPTGGTLETENSIGIDETIVNRILRLTPWWTIAPSHLSLRPGTSGGFLLEIAYTDQLLVPQDLEFQFVLEVFFGSVARTPAGVVTTDFIIAFRSGIASPATSFIVGNETQGGIGERLDFVVKLLDAFGHGPATAQFDSESFVSFRGVQVPRLTITACAISFLDTSNVLRLDILTGRGIVTEFRFGLELQADGQVEIDVKLGNTSLADFPMRIISNAIQCRLHFEVPDSTGTVCLCDSGHYRTEIGQCVPCSPGTFMPSASNGKTCSLCPKDFFAEKGESICHACVGRGIKCQGGIVSMEEGYWCEPCHQLQSPRGLILEQFRRGNRAFFHECIPSDSCIVNKTSFVSTCAPGYAEEGPVCNSCEPGFVKVSSGDCMRCERGIGDLILTIVGILAVVGVISIITVLSYRDAKPNVKSFEVPAEWGLSLGQAGKRNLLSIAGQNGVIEATISNPLHMRKHATRTSAKRQDHTLMRNLVAARHIALLLVDYFQIMFILHAMEISPFAFNSEWINTVSIMATFTPTQAGAVQCTMGSSPFQTSITTILSPIIVLVCVMIIQGLTALYQTRCKRAFPWSTFMSSFARSSVLVMNLIHMSVTNATFEVFDVYPIEIGSTKRSNLDLTMETSSSRHKLLRSIAIVSLVITVIGYPLLNIGYYLNLYSKAKTVEAFEQLSKVAGGFNVNRFGFLWESVVIIRKVALLLVVSFVTGPMAQLTWASTTLIVSVFLLAVLMPYKKKLVNYLQYIMILTSLVTLAIGFLIRVTLDAKGEQANIDTFSNVVFVLQLTLLLTAVIVQVSMAPKALKGLYIIVSSKLPQSIKRRIYTPPSQRDDQENSGWTITQSPLYDLRGIVLPRGAIQHSQLSIHHRNAIGYANMILQKENRRLYKAATKVKRLRQRSQELNSP